VGAALPLHTTPGISSEHILIIASVSSCRASFANFLEDADTKRLLVFLDGKDLGVVSAQAPLGMLFKQRARLCMHALLAAHHRTCAAALIHDTDRNEAERLPDGGCMQHVRSPSLRGALQAIKPPSKFKRKTVYFVKTAAAKLDNDSIKKLVSKRSVLPCSCKSIAVCVLLWCTAW
jgi:hypothetical protein